MKALLARIRRLSAKGLADLAKDDGGQTVVEFALVLLIATTFVSTISFMFRKSLLNLWMDWIGQIAAGCPKCPPPK